MFSAVRPSTLPSDYSNQNGNTNGYCQVSNALLLMYNESYHIL